MRLARPTALQRLTLAWIVALSIVAGAFAPSLHALARGGSAVPSLEVCSAQGLMVVADDSSSDPASAGTPHCAWCLMQLAAGLPPADRSLTVHEAAAEQQPAALPAPARRIEPWRHAAPRGPPASA